MARPLSNAKMFTATWTEKDEALLIDLLNRKINEMKFDIREADSPYIKARLRAKRKEYIGMRNKVIDGDYNPNVLAAELASAKVAQRQIVKKKEKKLGKYVDSYSDVDFDFKGFFDKTRFYHSYLPFMMMMLLIVLGVFILVSFVVPVNVIDAAETSLNNSGTARLTLTSVAYIKLGPDENDFRVPNDGNWPKGTFMADNYKLEQGELYTNTSGQTPQYVYLYGDLKMISIDITSADLMRAALISVFSKSRIDFIENMEAMPSRSWYYVRYMVEENRLNSMKIEKGEDGSYDWTVVIRYIATYGAPVCLWITILLCIIEFVICFIRLFHYTSRRLHVIPVLILLSGLFTILLPAFAELSALNTEAVKNAITGYFSFYWSDFMMASNTQTIAINYLYLILIVAVPVFLILWPITWPAWYNLFFKDKPITFVPKGNRPHIYAPDEMPVKPGRISQYGVVNFDPRKK
jgi:hypothetical protein